MDEEYDVIVLGTGLKECILSGLLSVDGLKENLEERLQECNFDEVLKAEAGAKAQKFTEWALKCISLHSRSQGSSERIIPNPSAEIQLRLSAFKIFLELAGSHLTGKDFTEAFDAACFPLTLFSSTFDPGWASGLSAVSIQALLSLLVEGGADNVNQCFLEASRFGSTELVRILLQVLHMDRNDYYGAESTSLNLIQLWKKFRNSDKPPAYLGSSRDYNVDMVPKFMMANGTLVRVLIHTDVTKYLYFKAVDGSYVFSKGKVHKVPATDLEALKSTLMGMFEKRRARKFILYVQDYKEDDPKTHEGMDLTRITTKELIAKYGLDDNTMDFIGHALALHRDDKYLHEPALDTVKRMKLYAESLARFQGGSPYIYPLYGLGELPQGFARLSAVYGGTYMLNKPDCKVEFNDEGCVIGVTSEGETAKCKKVVCDPSYLPSKVRKIGKVTRAICIMSHPIPNTNDSLSAQIILPQKQLSRNSDMYLFCCSYSHNVAPKGKYIAFVSAEAETDNPELELKPGVDLLGPVDEIFYDTYDRYEPVNEPSLDNCFISTSYDATTHFESTVMDVLNMYTLITGKVLDLSVDLSAASAAEE